MRPLYKDNKQGLLLTGPHLRSIVTHYRVYQQKIQVCMCYILYNIIRGVTRCAVKGGQGQKISHFPIFFPCRNFHFGTPQTNVRGFKKWQAKKKKKKEKKVPCSVSYFPLPFHFTFSSPPFTTISLLFLSIFSRLSFPFPLFPSPFPFSSFLPSFQNFPQTFQGWATHPLRPPLVMPLNIIHVASIILWFWCETK